MAKFRFWAFAVSLLSVVMIGLVWWRSTAASSLDELVKEYNNTLRLADQQYANTVRLFDAAISSEPVDSSIPPTGEIARLRADAFHKQTDIKIDKINDVPDSLKRLSDLVERAANLRTRLLKHGDFKSSYRATVYAMDGNAKGPARLLSWKDDEWLRYYEQR